MIGVRVTDEDRTPAWEGYIRAVCGSEAYYKLVGRRRAFADQ
jgi:hypothetical protein